MKNPYPHFLPDECVEQKFVNPQWEAWNHCEPLIRADERKMIFNKLMISRNGITMTINDWKEFEELINEK